MPPRRRYSQDHWKNAAGTDKRRGRAERSGAKQSIAVSHMLVVTEASKAEPRDVKRAVEGRVCSPDVHCEGGGEKERISNGSYGSHPCRWQKIARVRGGKKVHPLVAYGKLATFMDAERRTRGEGSGVRRERLTRNQPPWVRYHEKATSPDEPCRDLCGCREKRATYQLVAITQRV